MTKYQISIGRQMQVMLNHVSQKGFLGHLSDNCMMHRRVSCPYSSLLGKHLHEHRAAPCLGKKHLAQRALGPSCEEDATRHSVYELRRQLGLCPGEQTNVFTRNKPGHGLFALIMFQWVFKTVILLTVTRDFYFKLSLLLLSIKI